MKVRCSGDQLYSCAVQNEEVQLLRAAAPLSGANKDAPGQPQHPNAYA